MVIQNANLRRPRFRPAEDDAPLVVDPDGVKARAITPQGFEAISRWHGQIRQPAGVVQLDQFPQRDAGDDREAPVSLFLEKLRRIGIGKGLDHGLRLDGIRRGPGAHQQSGINRTAGQTPSLSTSPKANIDQFDF
jgi:hypothetical protein